MLKLPTVTAALALVLAYAPVSQAVTFNVNRTIGDGGVTGTIDTDGTLGVLSTANITDWNLTLDDSFGTFNLLGPVSGPNSQLLIIGNSFSATATDLLFNFVSGNSDLVLFQNPGIGSSMNAWCFANSVCGGGSGPHETVIGALFDNKQISPLSGLQSVATTVGAQAVPEPSSSLGLMLGTVGVASILKRKLKSAKSIEKELEKVS
jgi:hypothetical protein